MSVTSIEERIRNAALNDGPLVALLRTSPGAPFRWSTDGLMQGSSDGLKVDQVPALPVVVTQLISDPREYSHSGLLTTRWARVQFTIWGGTDATGAQAREEVGAALLAFFAKLNLSARSTDLFQPNFIEPTRNDVFQRKDGRPYRKMFDLMVFVDDST